MGILRQRLVKSTVPTPTTLSPSTTSTMGIDVEANTVDVTNGQNTSYTIGIAVTISLVVTSIMLVCCCCLFAFCYLGNRVLRPSQQPAAAPTVPPPPPYSPGAIQDYLGAAGQGQGRRPPGPGVNP